MLVRLLVSTSKARLHVHLESAHFKVNVVNPEADRVQTAAAAAENKRGEEKPTFSSSH